MEHARTAWGARARMLGRASLVLVLAASVVALPAPTAAAAPSAVPSPTVIGPVPARVPLGDPSHDYPFYATDMDLASRGFVEQEFFIQGTATRYATVPLASGTVISTGNPYETRIVVRRPVSERRFNGTVLVEWQNVTAGHDLDAHWLASADHLISEGYAWVGVSAQRVGVHQPVSGLKSWSPVRYGSLDVTAGGTILDDSLSYDIYSQAAQALRHPAGIDPMGGLHPQRLIAIGASQSEGRLVLYHNSIHPLAGMFDAFFLHIGGGTLRTDLDVKVFKMNSETEVAGGVPRLPDSDRLRSWEVAGASHVDRQFVDAQAPLDARDGITPASSVCTNPPLSQVPFRFALNSAIDLLVRWERFGIAPPSAPRIELASAAPPVVIARDEHGNALRGVRLPQHAVPTATNTGVNSGTGFCRLFGSHVDFDQATLDALYRNHGAYVAGIAEATAVALRSRWIGLADAEQTIRDAAHSDVGRH
jgi:Alpha/beta hydrolase domain